MKGWLKINNNSDDENKDNKYKIYPKSERITVVFFASVLVWGINDRFTTGTFEGLNAKYLADYLQDK